MIIEKPHFCTKLDIWAPKYSAEGGQCALLAVYKVEKSTPVILVNFTKAKHLIGQRFAIQRDAVLRCERVDNGKIQCYAVPMHLFSNWQTPNE